MKKSSIIIGGLVVIAGVVAMIITLYPAAVVNGSPIWYNTWNRYLRGTDHALAMQSRFGSTQYNPNPSITSLIRKDVLTTLIEDKIITQQARKLVSEFDARSEQRIHDVIKSSATIGKAAQALYGFNTSDFYDFILLPQSHREVIQEEFNKQKIDFSTWVAGIKKKADVKIFLYSYRWDGEGVK